MGVHMLLYWTAAEGAGRREAHDALAAAILCLGSTSSTRWAAQAAVMRQVQQRGVEDLPSARSGGGDMSLHRVTLGDEPGQLFLLSRSAKQVVQSDEAGMQAFLGKAVQVKQRGSLQLEGVQHTVGDFRVMLARAVQAPQQNFLGLALDICYLPLDDAQLAAPLLQDVAEVLREAAEAAGGTLGQVGDPAALGYQLPPAFSPRHRAVQYVQLMSALQE